MPRFLVAATSLLAGLLPLSAGALGLGEIELRSALNQPFLAEVPVNADDAAELAELRIELAPRETFERFGIERPAFLSDLAFSLQATGPRSGVIRITSDRPVTEPFVTLLIEARWPRGRLLREYTVLLDPPVFSGEALPRTPAEAAAPPVPAVVQPATPAPAAAAPAPAPAPAPAAPAAPARPLAPAVAPAGDYQVRRNDTLWQIANELRPADVSVNQMMLALFRANPEAFAGNINQLRAGVILRVPPGEELRRLAAGEATAEVARQNLEWRGPAEARLELVPPSDDVAPGAAVGEGRGADPALQGRVRELEAELAESRRLLALRDAELSALQARLAEASPEAAVPAPEAPVAPFVDQAGDAAPAADAPAEVPVDEPAVLAEAAPMPADAAAPAATLPPAAGRPPARAPLVELLTSVWLWGAAALVVLLSLVLMRRRRGSSDEDAELPGGGSGGWTAPVAVGGADAASSAATTAGADPRPGGMLVEEQEAERQTAAPAPADDEATVVARAPVVPQAGPDGTISPEAGLDMDQPDVLAEADFHMAYGLYDQAADLLNQAIEAEPGRRDLRLKLLEVLFVWENPGAFLRAAKALQEQVGDESDPDWNKVLIMGRQLCPEDPLFAAGPAVAVPGEVDLPLDDGPASSVVDFRLDESGQVSGDSIDFDLGEGQDDAPADDTARSAMPGETTMETPTLEVDYASDAPTMESPTLDTRMEGSPTMETPTIEARPDWGVADAPATDDEALDPDTLGLDLSELETAVEGLDSGVFAAPEPEPEAEPEAVEDTAEQPRPGVDGESSTGAPSGGAFPVLGGGETTALEPGMTETTAEQEMPGTEATGGFGPGILEADPSHDEDPHEGTAEQPVLSGPRADEEELFEDLGIDLDRVPDFGDGSETRSGPGLDPELWQMEDTASHAQVTDDAETELFRADLSSHEDYGDEEIEPTASLARLDDGLDGPTMTEVGTKLDLARAYVDMGDPDGARSILNEVLEEGDSGQRQQARQLLGELDD